jgi:O-antigen/teichoic acid export membrane protein
MNTAQQVAKNTSVVMGGDLTFRLISLLVIAYLGRYLGPVGFGKYNFVFAYLSLFGVISNLGLQTILVREMSREPSTAPKLIGNAYIIRTLLTILAVALALIAISFMSYPPDTTSYIYVASFTLLFISFSDFYATIFQANLKMAYREIAKLTFKLIESVLIFWIIFSQGTLMQVMIVHVFAEMVKTLISFVYSRKLVIPKLEIDVELWKYLMKEALPISLAGVIFIIYARIDIIMLSMMQGDASVGIYSAAHKLSEPLSLIPIALLTSVFPIMSASSKTSTESLIRLYNLSTRYLYIITIPISVGITVLAEKIIRLIYGAEFADSALVLQLLIWTLVVSSAAYVLTDLLISTGKQKQYSGGMAFSAIANVALNYILIPKYSYNGAAIATVLTNLVLFLASFYFCSKQLHLPPVRSTVIKSTIGGILMGAVVYYFMEVNIVLQIVLGAGIYLMSLLALKTFSSEDFYIIKRVLLKTR